MASPAQLNAAMAQAKTDPHVQAAMKAWLDFKAKTGVWNPGHGTGGPQTAFQTALQPYLPPGTMVTMGPQGDPVITNKGVPSWVFPVALMAVGLTAGAATGAFAGAGAAPVASAAPAAGGDWAAELGTTGLTTSGGGEAAVGVGGKAAVGTAAKTGLGLGKILNWAAPMAATGISSFLSNRRAGKIADQQAESDRQRNALLESQQDPFRGFTAQAHDAAGLDWMSQDQTPRPTQLDPKYGAGLTLPAPRSYGPSPETRAFLRAALARVTGGDTATPVTPGATPLPVVKRKKSPVDPNTWTYE